MKRLHNLLLVLCLVLGLVACAKAPTWQEQYDLGVRYLSAGNYEEAIIAFTAAIEIDPKQAEAYIKLADAYVGAGDVDGAIEVLREAVLKCVDSAQISDILTELEMAQIEDLLLKNYGYAKRSHCGGDYDNDGLTEWFLTARSDETANEHLFYFDAVAGLIPLLEYHTMLSENALILASGFSNVWVSDVAYYCTFGYDNNALVLSGDNVCYGCIYYVEKGMPKCLHSGVMPVDFGYESDSTMDKMRLIWEQIIMDSKD